MGWTDPRAVFFTPHPDDDTLSMGVDIANHVAAGREVHIVGVTRGGASGARSAINGDIPITPGTWWGMNHDPVQEGYDPLDVPTFEAVREGELRAAAAALGVLPEHVHIYDLPDGGVAVADVATIIQTDFAWPGASFKTLSYRWEGHPDHFACGNALLQLQKQHPEVWGDARWYVFRPYWAAADPDPSTFYVTPRDATCRQRVLNACKAYASYSPRYGVFGAGMLSVESHFTALLGDVRCMVQTA